jgi:hypothetical protein
VLSPVHGQRNTIPVAEIDSVSARAVAEKPNTAAKTAKALSQCVARTAPRSQASRVAMTAELTTEFSLMARPQFVLRAARLRCPLEGTNSVASLRVATPRCGRR